MIRKLTLAAVFASAVALSAVAQDAKSTTTPGVTTIQSTPVTTEITLILTDLEGKSWIDKPVYSSDGQKIGEVAAFQRDAGNKVLAMHANVGGYFGWLQKRVSLQPRHFKLQNDRAVLDMTAEQAKQLPKVQS